MGFHYRFSFSDCLYDLHLSILLGAAMNNKMYICEDCTFVFQLHTSFKSTKNKPFCPKCGENLATTKYKADRLTKRKKGDKIVRIKWTARELELLDKCVAGELEPHQVAIQTGRSINSVLKKIPRRREELA